MPSFNSMVLAGKLACSYARQGLINTLADLEGQSVTITVEKIKAKRSLDQNSYYRAVVLPNARNFIVQDGDPMTLDNAHEGLLLQFAPTVATVTLDGEIITRAKRTHEMSVQEMNDYITAITVELAQRGWQVPPPTTEGTHHE